MYFVGGLSGSGKTSTIERFTREYPKYIHVRASKVLMKIGRPIEELTLGQVLDNQIVLQQYLTGLPAEVQGTSILDGHGIIPSVVPVRVPLNFFTSVGFHTILCLTDKPSAILARRKWPAGLSSVEAIASLQDEEVSWLQFIATKAGARFSKLESPTDGSFRRAILGLS